MFTVNEESDTRRKNTIYQFKTLHGTTAMNPQGKYFEKYEELSTDEQSYYQWSNDNNVYTELSAPGFEEMEDGFHVFFVGENPPLDNTLANGLVGTPRNIGFVKVSKEDTRVILSDGATETGGYYTFNGDFYE